MSRKRKHKPEPDRINKIPVPKGGNGSLAMQAVAQPEPESVRVLDAFQNVLARQGYGTTNLGEGADYVNTRLTRDFMLLTTLYRSHWVIRKIVDVPAEDMCKNWITLSSTLTPEQIDAFQRAERKTKTRTAVLKALKWGRLYGGAGALMIIKGQQDYLDQPLDYDSIAPNSYRGLIVFDRWSGITPGMDVITDLDSPDFGLPASYQITLGEKQSFEAHSSRILRFPGRYLPYWEEQAEVKWGISEIELVFDELKKRDNTSWNIASLVFLANIRVMKMGDLRSMLATGNAKIQAQFYNTIAAQNHVMSNQGLLVLDKDDDYEQHETTGFRGIADVYESFMLDLAGAAEMPVTKLFGRAPAGMNATGESDLQNYYDSIEQKQESCLRPVLEKLLPIMAMSEWGYVPDDFDFNFNPPATVPSDKLAELAGKKTSSVVDVYNSGLISQKTAVKELRQMSDETGMWSNITDEDIARADSEIQPPEGAEGFPGMEGLGSGGVDGQGTPPPLGESSGTLPASSPTQEEEKAKTLGIIRKMREFIRGWLKSAEKPAIDSPIMVYNQDPYSTRKGELWCGFDVHIENPAGSFRSGVDSQGHMWQTQLQNPYGFIGGVKGVDKDHLDVFLGPDPKSQDVFIVDQIDPYTHRFDEHKIILGAHDIGEAKAIYLGNYQDGWQGLGAISRTDAIKFRDWIRHGGPGRGPYVSYSD